MAEVVITGVGGPAGRSVAAGMRERGVGVLGVDMAPVELDGVATARVPRALDRRFGPALAAVARDAGAALVVPTVDEELPVLARCGLAGVAVAVGRAPAVAAADDKWLTALLLAHAGVAVPRSALAGSAPDDELDALLGSPHVAKPRTARGARGVRLQLGGGRAEPGTLLQEWAPGTEYAVQLYVAALDVVVVLEKTALAGGDIGNATAVRRVDAADVGATALAAARGLGLTGAVDVDVRRRADGTPLVLELNARFGAHAAHAPEVLDALVVERLPTMLARA